MAKGRERNDSMLTATPHPHERVHCMGEGRERNDRACQLASAALSRCNRTTRGSPRHPACQMVVVAKGSRAR